MNTIAKLLESIRNEPNCIVYPPNGLPNLPPNLQLPPELNEFYTECGGIALYPNKNFGIEIVKPADFKRANPVLVGENCEYDISFNWFIIARSGQQYITMDLEEKRAGLCYDSFWDRHGIAGECSIVAQSFTELVDRLYKSNGDAWYWLEPNFKSYGDAYDVG